MPHSSRPPTLFLGCSLLSIAFSIALGAFGSHCLKAIVSDQELLIFQKANFYHLTQSLGLVLLTLLPDQSSRWLKRSQILVALGAGLFSGSLYLLSLVHWTWLAWLAPLGGAFLIIGWLFAGLKFVMFQDMR